MIHAPPNPLKVGSDNFRVLHGLQSREHHFPILIPMPVPSKGAPFLGLPSPDVLSEYVPDRLRVPPRLKESSTPVTVGNCQKLCGKTLIAPERRFFPWEKSALGQPIGKHTQKTGSKFTLGLAVGGIEFLIEPRIAQKVRENNMQFSSEANCGFEPQCVNQLIPHAPRGLITTNELHSQARSQIEEASGHSEILFSRSYSSTD